MSDEDPDDPFKLNFPSNGDRNSPAKARAAFRNDPQGVLSLGGGCRISRDGQTVRKAGRRVRVGEGRALDFARSLNLPVPVVHEVNIFDQRTEIVMDFVPGECLEEAWPAMDEQQKRSVAQQIGHLISTMRQVSSEQRPIGAFGGPARDLRQIDDYSGGPFDCEQGFNSFVLDVLPGTPPLIRSTMADALGTSSRIVLTHGDLSPRNIMVEGYRVSGLLDWEYAGWYPEYFEYVKFFDRPTDCRDWKQYADIIFDTKYPKELLTFQALARWQRP